MYMGLFDLYRELPLPWSPQDDFAHDLAKERKGCVEETHYPNPKEISCSTLGWRARVRAHCKSQNEGRLYSKHLSNMS